MKFQLKALVAALALVAAVPASAAIAPASSGDSSFVLSVWDAANNISASFDLGINYSQFTVASNATQTVGSPWAVNTVNEAGTQFSWDFTSGDYAAAWAGFTATANEENASWAITAADNLGTGVGSRGFITTYTGAPLGNFSTNATVNLVGGFNVFTDRLATNESVFQNHSTTANGASVALNGVGAYAPAYYVNGRNLNVGPFSAGLINSSLGVIQTVSTASGIGQAFNTIYSNANGISTFTLNSNGQLTYAAAVAAVPEPETYAMLLAGLGFMGFVARRKQAK